MLQLSDENQNSVGAFCQEAFENINTRYPSIWTMIVQFKNEKISIGKVIRGKFSPKYYSDADENTDGLKTIVDDNLETMRNIKKAIDTGYPNKRLKGFLISYNYRTKEISICGNSMKSNGVNETKLFESFNYDK